MQCQSCWRKSLNTATTDHRVGLYYRALRAANERRGDFARQASDRRGHFSALLALKSIRRRGWTNITFIVYIPAAFIFRIQSISIAKAIYCNPLPIGLDLS